MGSSSSTAAPIPTKMKRIVLVEANDDLEKAKFEVQECDVPKPKDGEVLVRMVAAPVNPSDYGNWRSANTSEPLYLGKEGCGVVVASGGGMKSNGMVGKNVGIFVRDPKVGGTYQEYVCVKTIEAVFELPASLPIEDAASFFVNPFTAVGIMATMREVGSPGMVHTAAASQLGQMLVKLCQKENVTLINVVRREDQAQILRDIGAEHVVVSSKEGWKDELAKLIKDHNITCAFDAIAGESTGDMMGALPSKGTCFVYGGLSSQNVSGISPMDLIYRKKKVEGWLLTNYLTGASGGIVGTVMRMNNAAKQVLPELGGDTSQEKWSNWAKSQFVDTTMEEMWPKFLEMRKGTVTNQKLRIRFPQPEPAPAEPAAASPAVAATEASPAAASSKAEELLTKQGRLSHVAGDKYSELPKLEAGQVRVEIFVGNKDGSTSGSWCPDCRKSVPLVLEAVLPTSWSVVGVGVGERDDWKLDAQGASNPFRANGFDGADCSGLKGVPTMRLVSGKGTYGEVGRLESELEEEDETKVKASLESFVASALKEAAAQKTPKVLMISTSAAKMGDHNTGLWSEECTGPYYVFKDAGCDVTVCSIAGGDVPVDAGSLSADFKTENDTRMEKESADLLKGTPKLGDQNIESFDILFFSGGHGTCVDFPTDEVGGVISKAWAAGKIVAAVCHGPMALVKSGILNDKKVACFSDKEEEMVGLTGKVPFSLEAKMKELGATVEVSDPWSDKAIRDGNLVTGQNPQSSVSVAKLCLERA